MRPPGAEGGVVPPGAVVVVVAVATEVGDVDVPPLVVGDEALP